MWSVLWVGERCWTACFRFNWNLRFSSRFRQEHLWSDFSNVQTRPSWWWLIVVLKILLQIYHSITWELWKNLVSSSTEIVDYSACCRSCDEIWLSLKPMDWLLRTIKIYSTRSLELETSRDKQKKMLKSFSVYAFVAIANAANFDNGLRLGDERNLNEKTGRGNIFTMAQCPGKCLSTTASQPAVVDLDDCVTSGNYKYWEVLYNCAGDTSFFKISHVESELCISEPDDCSVCDDAISLVDCDDDMAAWFSYGNLHKTSPKAYYLYSARCWLKEGQIAVLATPSLEAKTCPTDHSFGACQRVEWNLDHFSKDVLYYEFSFNPVSSHCSGSLGLL